MSEWDEHNVTDGRLFCFAASLWLVGMAVMYMLIALARSLDAFGALPRDLVSFLLVLSFGLLGAGMFYEKLISGLARAVVWLRPTAAVEDGDRV